jgi:hypothetical protein
MKEKILILFFSLLLIAGAKNVYAQQPINDPTPTPSPIYIKYDLAYPGILPDNPFYKLKVLRDKISLALITDPLKKMDYLLLQADKGILATAMLVDKNQISLAETTALKAENNYTLIANELNYLSKKPKNELFTKLETASKKHQEVLTDLLKRIPKNKQKTFLQVIDFSKRNLETIRLYRIGTN